MASLTQGQGPYKRAMTTRTRAEIAALYNSGLAVQQVADRVGFSACTIRSVLQRLGVALRDREGPTTCKSVHNSLRCHRGRACDHTCPCGAPAEEWSYNHSGIGQRTINGRTFSIYINQYDALCRRCHNARDGRTYLTDREVEEVRWQRATGEWTMAQLADSFGVSITTIRKIVQRRTRRYLSA